MVILATRTLAAFEAAVEQDQGNTFRQWLGRVIPHMGDAYRVDTEPFRTHMGASTMGRECAREIWYSFHWATARKASGRMLRLWNRGHLEEARFIALLLTIGCEVIQHDENGKQFRISDAGGHYGGSGDGLFRGCPDLPPGTLALSEFKTHNDKSFQKLKVEGVRASKFEHYVQMQQYMRKMGLAVAVYFAVNKNDDEIYAEVVPLDSELADRFIHRAITIVPMRAPPDRISKTPGWFGCKFCDHKMVCHYGAAPARNCRSCEWSSAAPDGSWQCDQPDVVRANGEVTLTLSKALQFKGCDNWSRNRKAFT